MKTSDRGIALIKQFEGLILTAYTCPAGVLTIGYGHTRTVRTGQTISREEADRLLRSDLEQFEEAINRSVRTTISQNQFDALVSFVFNVGVGAFEKSTLLRKLNGGDFDGAANEFDRWNKVNGRSLEGLTRRRAREKSLFLEGKQAMPDDRRNEFQYPMLLEISRNNGTINLTNVTDPILIREIQLLLNAKGFNAGAVDGIVGNNTVSALERAKDYLNLQYPTMLGRTTIDRLIDLASISDDLFQPTNGIGRVSSSFNPIRRHPVTGVIRPHRGTDIAIDRGTPIYAVADGVVSQAIAFCQEGVGACGGGFGNHIRISHTGIKRFNESVYAHLQQVSVRAGDRVKRGQQIGTGGNTGISSGPHLHFEIRLNGTALDPEKVIRPIV